MGNKSQENKGKSQEPESKNDLFFSLILIHMLSKPYNPLQTAFDDASAPEKTSEKPAKIFDFSIPESRVSYRTALNDGIAHMTEALRGVKYKFGGKDLRGIDCSGFVAAAVGKAFSLAGVSEKFIGDMQTNSEGQLNVMESLGVKIHHEDTLSRATVENGVPMFVAMDTKKTWFDGGRKNGIDHVALIYRNENGQMMVSQSTGKKGVGDMPFDQWLDQQHRNGTKLYAADLGEVAIAAKEREMALATQISLTPDEKREAFKRNLADNSVFKSDPTVKHTFDFT